MNDTTAQKPSHALVLDVTLLNSEARGLDVMTHTMQMARRHDAAIILACDNNTRVADAFGLFKANGGRRPADDIMVLPDVTAITDGTFVRNMTNKLGLPPSHMLFVTAKHDLITAAQAQNIGVHAAAGVHDPMTPGVVQAAQRFLATPPFSG